jgi:ABC-type sugar transport system ATPase subunit
MADDIVTFAHITKAFVGVAALSDVSLSIRRGECHGLMGENGAGKSTLGKVLAGIHRPDGATMTINGVPHVYRSPADALAAGVAMVHQELAFCPALSVAENLSLGVYPRKFGLFVDREEMRRRADKMLARIGVTLDVDRDMRELTTAQEQLVQIAGAVGTGADVIVFDEPTSSLSEVDAQRLLSLIEQLKRDGKTIVYVSHRMPELFRICDRISVLRDGKYVGTLDKAEATHDSVVRMMVGRNVEAHTPKHTAVPGAATRLRVEHLSSPGKFADVSFTVNAGEVVGFAGLVGSGRSEVAQAIFGLDRRATGTVSVDGKVLRVGDIDAAKRAGVGLVPEDRKRQGLVLGMGGLDNTCLSMLERLSQFGAFFRAGVARQQTQTLFDRLRVKTPSIDTAVGTLSGGNQQKVALAKWIGRGCDVLILDEPTRGVDVGAKATIHQLIDELAGQGLAIVVISSELPEVIGVSSRVLVMREGRIVADVPRAQATQEVVLRHMSGVAANVAA